MSTFNTLFVGKVLQYFSAVESTNRCAADLLAKTKPIEGTVISAGYQSAGRGQIGSSWHSEADKNVLLSIILYPSWLPIDQQFGLSMAMALAVSDTLLNNYSIPAKVKWPNDVYVKDQKIAGILIQNSIASSGMKSSIIGLGINVNQTNFPTALPNPVSAAFLQKKELDLSLFQTRLFTMVEQRYLQLKKHPSIIKEDYLQRLYRFEEWHFYKKMNDSSLFEGKIIGIQKSGKIELQTRQGITQLFDLKEIQFQ